MINTLTEHYVCFALPCFTRQPCLCRQRVVLPWAIVRSQWLLHVHGMHYHDTSGTLLLSLPSDGN